MDDAAGAAAADEAMIEWTEEPVRWFDTPDELCACPPPWEASGLDEMFAGYCEGERLGPAFVLNFQSTEGGAADADEERTGECGKDGDEDELRSREMRFVVCTLSPFSESARRRSCTLEVAGSSPSVWSRSLLIIRS